jgi:glutamyl-tRNA reductase
MYCQYLSHKRSNHRALARLEPDFIKSIQPEGSVCIRTCHRLEFYSNSRFELPEPPHSLGSTWTEVSGLLPVLTRIACLAAGVDSRILGEQFVAYQCSRPFLKSYDPSLPYGLISGALDIASRLKKSLRFHTAFSYDDAAFASLMADCQRLRPPHLVVFGAGLLGQAIVEHQLAREYQSVQVITRSPRDFLATIRPVAGPSLLKATTLGDAHLPTAYDCVIATDNRNPAFAAKVNQLLNVRNAGHVIDLCAVPVLSDDFSDQFGAHHMECPFMQSLIDSANSRLESLVAPLTAAISAAVSHLCVSHGA